MCIRDRVGIIGERDLIGQQAAHDSPRREWWLSQLAQGDAVNADFLASMDPAGRLARDIMTREVVAVAEDAPLEDIARLMTERGLKRIPVLRAGRPVGIVSRIDLVRHLCAGEPPRPALDTAVPAPVPLPPEPARPQPPARQPGCSAAGFRLLVEDYHHAERDLRDTKGKSSIKSVAGGPGFEPRLTESESLPRQ